MKLHISIIIATQPESLSQCFSIISQMFNNESKENKLNWLWMMLEATQLYLNEHILGY